MMAETSGWIRPCPKCNYPEAFAYFDVGRNRGLRLVSTREEGADTTTRVWCPACEYTWNLEDFEV